MYSRRNTVHSSIRRLPPGVGPVAGRRLLATRCVRLYDDLMVAKIVLLPIVLILSCIGCGTSSTVGPAVAQTGRTPIVVVGIDGLEWRVLQPLLRDGRMPNLAKLIQAGAAGKLETLEPTVSPTIWTTVATGTDREAHGILGFVLKDEESEENGRMLTNRDRRTKAFWNILSDYERSVAVVGWWMTFPVETIRGVMVAQTNTTASDGARDRDKIWKGTVYAGVEGQVWPPELQAEVFGYVDEVDRELPELIREVLGEMPAQAGPVPRRLMEKCGWALRADEIYRRVARRLLRDAQGLDLFAVYFGTPDVMGHRFWRYIEPGAYDVPPTPEEVEMFGDYLARSYVHADGVLGELMDAAPGADFVVLSDHGMQAVNVHSSFADDLPARQLRSGGHPEAPPGVLIVAGPSFRKRATSLDDPERIASVFDITPTLLAMLGVPVGRDMPGKPLEDLLVDEVLEEHPLNWVDSHTPPDWQLAHWADEIVPAVDDAQRLEQLRSLGYLDD